jgi:hypothetical protein
MDVSSLTGAIVSLNKSAVGMDVAIATFREQVKADRAIVGLIEVSVEASKAANATGQLSDIKV